MNTYTFKAEGMHCQSCEILIKEELTELPGVSEITVDYSTGEGSFSLDESLSTQDDVIAAIKNAGAGKQQQLSAGHHQPTKNNTDTISKEAVGYETTQHWREIAQRQKTTIDQRSIPFLH